MSYKAAVERMYALGHELANTPSQKFDLAHMRVLLAALDRPEKWFPAVLIAGTNGKGSTAATLAAILKASGVRAGLYTSPHLIKINERIRIDGEEISDDDFALIHDVVDRTAERLVSEGELPWHPSFFEMVTAIAFEYFAKKKIDIAVLEVGMGGRLDATNVVDPIVSVITDVALDHQKFLGDTIAEIAREKAGIIRPDRPVVTLPQLPQANDVIGNAILKTGARAVSAAQYVPPVSPAVSIPWNPHLGATREVEASREGEAGRDGHGFSRAEEPSTERALAPEVRTKYQLQVLGKEIMVETPLVGRHQLRNLALAIAAAEELSKQGFAITADSIERGMRETRWPGRFQVLPRSADRPEIILDVAHNPAGAWALRSTISSAYENRRLVFVFGAMRDKAIAEIAEILFPVAEKVVITQADNPRSASPSEIREAASRTGNEMEEAPDVAEALTRARVLAGSDGVLVVTGSIYIVGEAMRQLGARI